MRRLLLRLAAPALAAGLLAAPAAAGPEPPTRHWAHAEIARVVAAGLLADDAALFRPDETLTRAELVALVEGLTGERQPPVVGPRTPVTIEALNARLVRALGLADAAAALNAAARAAGLAPPARFGNEVVARLLGLRKNHPAGSDELERLPGQHASRAEAAYSADRILRFSGWEVERAREAALGFALPELRPWERRVLQTAFSFVGFPYVWGGTSERKGVQAQGGFDCSGFVWRVYKLQGYEGAPALAAVLRGRTTYAMSGEVPAAVRIPAARLGPADVVFFGLKGPRSKPAEVDHMGIAIGNGWMVHSSRDGVTLTPLEGWYERRLAWGRRPLEEAGVVPARTPVSR
jgi:cell wall-associated NlpC family hydrolase